MVNLDHVRLDNQSHHGLDVIDFFVRWRTAEVPRFGAIQNQKWFPYDYKPNNYF